MHATLSATPKQIAARRAIVLWLYSVAFLVFAVTIVGGATRLTGSGLSITEWEPIIGLLPPFTEAGWLAEFEKYRQIPQYQVINRGMSLAEFKVIYWWEWGHRLLGRLIGFAFFFPLVVLWFSGRIERSLTPRLLGLLALGAAQGVMGWYMVMSGLVELTYVSQYRLAAHLTLAVVIFAALIWVALGIGRARSKVIGAPGGWAALALLGLIMMQIAAGGFVAGLHAGLAYNTWPLMDGSIIPAGLGIMEPWWRNLFENALTVQFIHRMLAYALIIAAVAHAAAVWREPGLRASALLIVISLLAQSAIGIATLLAAVPKDLALIHQGGGLVVVIAAVWHLHLISTTAVSLPAPANTRTQAA